MFPSGENDTYLQPGKLFQLSNLFSLFRVAIIPLLGYYLAQPDQAAAVKALVIIIVAGISDGLDGFFARKLDQVSKLGMILDPLADKILALAMVIFLILFRDFPLWLAAVIVGRDLLILAAAAMLLRGKKVVVPSITSGKYAFATIVVLLACSVIRFEFGVTVMTYIVLVLVAVSFTNYLRLYGAIEKGETLPPFNDQPLYRILRICATVLVLLFLLVKLYHIYAN
jgi:CDP-diacylglycerol--glycerol-3-phosphate 3-phosphatidyltransferase